MIIIVEMAMAANQFCEYPVIFHDRLSISEVGL